VSTVVADRVPCPECQKPSVPGSGLAQHRKARHGVITIRDKLALGIRVVRPPKPPTPATVRRDHALMERREQLRVAREQFAAANGVTWPVPGFTLEEAVDKGDLDLVEEWTLFSMSAGSEPRWLTRSETVGGTRWCTTKAPHLHHDLLDQLVERALHRKIEAA
jgi:hypothetical protein